MSKAHAPDKLKSLVKALPVFVFIWMLLLSVRPLKDVDVWWHIKAGEHTAASLSLPADKDPFSISASPPERPNAMTTQWLGDVLFYGSYRIGGLPGVSAMRGALIVFPFIFLYFRFLRRGFGPLNAASYLMFPLLVIVVSLNYTFERPQAFSFVFAMLLAVLVEDWRERGGRRLIFTVPLMALWGNVHGAYVVGSLIIMIYAFSETLKFLFKSRHALERERLFFFLPVMSLAFFSAFLNPEGWRLFGSAVLGRLSLSGGSSEGMLLRAEWLGLKRFSEVFGAEIWPPFAAAFIILGFSALLYMWIRQRGADATEVLMLVFSSALGLSMARGVMFSFLLLPVFFSRAGGAGRKIFSWVSFALILVWVFMALRFGFGFVPNAPDSWTDARFPEGAARFLKENPVGGAMFNYREWGGFLLFHGFKTFTDTRAMDKTLYRIHDEVLLGKKGWEKTLDRFGINFVIAPIVATGENYVPPLVVFLSEAKTEIWQPIYYDGNAVVFLRDAPSNRPLIDKYHVPKWKLLKDMLMWADYMVGHAPEDKNILALREAAIKRLGGFPEGVEFLDALKGKKPFVH